MKSILGFGNAVFLVLNLSTLGTVAYKGRLWQPESEVPSSGASQPLGEVVDLSSTQAQSIQANREALAEEWAQNLEELRSSRERLLAALRNEGANPNELWPLIEAIGSVQTQLEKRAVAQLLQERDLLKPQQQERYFSYLENRLREGCGCTRGFRGGRMGDETNAPGQPGRGRGRGKGPPWRR